MSKRPEILDAAVPELRKMPAAVGNFAAGKMCVAPTHNLKYWLGHGVDVDPMRKHFAESFIDLLNSEMWLDGHWVVIWKDFDLARAEYRSIVWAFLDRDNDLQFTVESDDPFPVLVETVLDRVSDAFDAWMQWKQTMQVMNIRPEDQIKAALGQKSKDPFARPSIDLLAFD